MPRTYSKHEAETLPSTELFRVWWNAPYLVLGFIDEGKGRFSAHTCHAEDPDHAQMYATRYLDAVCGVYMLTPVGYQPTVI